MWFDYGVRISRLFHRSTEQTHFYNRSAVATILFSEYPLRPAAFTLAAASLLSGLIASGIAVSLIYALGDLKGLQYKVSFSGRAAPCDF